MKVLHVVKTSDGAVWAARQAAELVRLGVEVHAVLPDLDGRVSALWKEGGAHLHAAMLDIPLRHPWRLPTLCREARRLVAALRPDLIHTHHVGPTMLLRMALGRNGAVPRVFQVPGPLHMEHGFFRRWDISSAGPLDFWISASRYIDSLYAAAGVARERLFVSYPGFETAHFGMERTGVLRSQLSLSKGQLVVGNVSYMYAPKRYLGQYVGLKCHEDVIDALGAVLARRDDVVGVLAGSAWGGATAYEKALQTRARAVGKGRILMPGYIPAERIPQVWPDFDCAVHVPLSENCGGVVEPLVSGVPIVAGATGGIPEVVFDGITGKLVPARRPSVLAEAILEVLGSLDRYRALAQNGRRLVQPMFDVRRTAREIVQVYRHILDPSSARPAEFDPVHFVNYAHAAVS